MIIVPFLWAGAVALGACVGSFIATAAMRGVRGEGFLAGRSHCDACGQPLSFGQTIPVLSYVALRGACADCRSPISRLHPAAEVAGVAIAAGAMLQPGVPQALLVATLGATLLATALIDSRTQRLPDALTLIIALAAGSLAWIKGEDQLWFGLAAAILAFVILEGLRRVFLWRRGESGLGVGDVKLVAALALWLGPLTPFALALASLAGLAWFAAFRPAAKRLAFGPFIAAAAFLVGSAGGLVSWLA